MVKEFQKTKNKTMLKRKKRGIWFVNIFFKMKKLKCYKVISCLYCTVSTWQHVILQLSRILESINTDKWKSNMTVKVRIMAMFMK